jgi:protein TonB
MAPSYFPCPRHARPARWALLASALLHSVILLGGLAWHQPPQVPVSPAPWEVRWLTLPGQSTKGAVPVQRSAQLPAPTTAGPREQMPSPKAPAPSSTTTDAQAPVEPAGPSPVATAAVPAQAPLAQDVQDIGAVARGRASGDAGTASPGKDDSGAGSAFDVDAAYLHNPRPVYPQASRSLGEQGQVRLRVHVNTDGTVLELAVAQSSGHERLDKAALSAVRAWRFQPAQRQAQQADAWVLVPISFALRSP